jgi:hypothetical protein
MRYIEEYQIRTQNGNIKLASIDRLEVLADHIQEFGVFDIAKISFYITDTDSPGEFCNIIVRQWDSTFIPEFCEEHVSTDWSLVMDALRFENLDDMLVQYIQQPDQS